MTAGEMEDGSAVLRLKIDMSSPNINLRDPAIYRIKRDAEHPQTGRKWKVCCWEKEATPTTSRLACFSFKPHSYLLGEIGCCTTPTITIQVGCLCPTLNAVHAPRGRKRLPLPQVGSPCFCLSHAATSSSTSSPTPVLKVYPMYDYAHSLNDALEGITHSLCTTEFEAHRCRPDGFCFVLFFLFGCVSGASHLGCLLQVSSGTFMISSMACESLPTAPSPSDPPSPPMSTSGSTTGS
jgi:hypothetical protein